MLRRALSRQREREAHSRQKIKDNSARLPMSLILLDLPLAPIARYQGLFIRTAI